MGVVLRYFKGSHAVCFARIICPSRHWILENLIPRFYDNPPALFMKMEQAGGIFVRVERIWRAAILLNQKHSAQCKVLKDQNPHRPSSSSNQPFPLKNYWYPRIPPPNSLISLFHSYISFIHPRILPDPKPSRCLLIRSQPSICIEPQEATRLKWPASF